MDPQIKSLFTTIIGYGATALSVWAAGHGLIDAGQQTALVNILVTMVGAIAAAAIAEWKRRSQSPKALVTGAKSTFEGQVQMIEAINKPDNGLKVVSVNVPAPMETEPLKGAK